MARPEGITPPGAEPQPAPKPELPKAGEVRTLFMDTPAGIGEKARIHADALRARGMKPAGARSRLG